MTERKVFYLAHPLAPDDKYDVKQNMEHVVHMTRLFFELGIYVCTPYHTTMLALDDNNLEHRRMGIEADLVVLKKLNRIIIVGHKLSTGCKEEMNLIASQADGEVHVMVGLSDDRIREICKDNPYFL